MSKYQDHTQYSPIRFLSAKSGFAIADVCRMLMISEVTMLSYIRNPSKIRLQDLSTMAGMFGISVLELVYLLMVNKPQSKKEDKAFIASVKASGDSNLADIFKE